MAERPGPSRAAVSLGKPSGGIGLVSRSIGGAERRSVSVTSPFSSSRSSGLEGIGSMRSFIPAPTKTRSFSAAERYATPFAPSIPSGERSGVKPTPIKSGPTVSSVSGLIAQNPYEGMFGSGRISGRAENTPVSLAKEPKFNASTKNVEPVRSFIKKLPGGEISPQVSERQATPTRTLYYPTWGRTQSVERPSPTRIAEVRQALKNINTGERVSLSKVAGTAPESRPVVENKPNSAVSYGALLAKREEIKSGHPETRPIGVVRTDIQRVENTWTPKMPDTVASPSVEPNKTVVSTGKAERSPHRGSAFLRIMADREERKKTKLSAKQKTAPTSSNKIDSDSLHQTNPSDTTSESKATINKPSTHSLREKLVKSKDKIKSMIAPKFAKKQGGENSGNYIVDKEAQQARENSARKAIDAADKGTGIVDGREIVALMGEEPTNSMVSGLLKMIGINVANKQVDGSYAKLTKMIASIGFVEKKVARRAVRDGVASYRAVAYSKKEVSSSVTEREVETVQGGQQSEYDLAA